MDPTETNQQTWLAIRHPHLDKLKEAPGGQLEVKAGRKSLCLAKIFDDWYATDLLCPHMEAPLSRGKVTAEGQIVCPWHQYVFDLKTGACKEVESLTLKTYPVKLEGDEVLVLLD
ncbi:MAG: Rieske (2Fe-2S) protein [Bacteroidota bacterium]